MSRNDPSVHHVPRGGLTKLLGMLMISMIVLLQGCKEPEGRVGPAVEESAEDRKATLAELKAEAVPDVDGLHFRQTAHKLKNCRECHTEKGLINPKGMDYSKKLAHWDVKLAHAKKVTCKSCHDPKLPDRLTIDKESVPIKESYKLCGACHSKQLADWKGGAHGKRLTGWGQTRVVTLCVECHNPHKPHFKADATVAPPMIVPPRLKGGQH
jgi:hypothetical protein